MVISIIEYGGVQQQIECESFEFRCNHVTNWIKIKKSDSTVFYQRKVRCHNRQIHKSTILKGGVRKNNQAAYEVKGFRLFDTVRYNGKTYIVFGCRTSGFMDIRTLSGDRVNNGSVSFKKLRLVAHNNSFIVERRIAG